MEEKEILKKLEKIISKKTNEKVQKNSTLKDLGIDSLDVLDLIGDVEDSFKIEVSDDELMNLKNINDIMILVKEKNN